MSNPLSRMVQRIAQPRQVTWMQFTSTPMTDRVAVYGSDFQDYERRMTHGLVADGVAADGGFRATGGVSD